MDGEGKDDVEIEEHTEGGDSAGDEEGRQSKGQGSEESEESDGDRESNASDEKSVGGRASVVGFEDEDEESKGKRLAPRI